MVKIKNTAVETAPTQLITSQSELKIVSSTAKRVEISMPFPGASDASYGYAISLQVGILANQTGVAHSARSGWRADSIGMVVEQFLAPTEGQISALATSQVSDGVQLRWRSQVFCHEAGQRAVSGRLIAEVTQKFVMVVDDRTESSACDIPAVVGEGRPKDTASRKDEALADRRRQQIFRGACEVISTKGWANASVRDISHAAQINIPTMYQYISNKEDILYLVTSMCMEEILEYFQKEVNDEKAPLDSLVDAIAAYFTYINKNRRYINLVYSETRSLNDANRKRIFQLEQEFIQMWETIIIRGNELGVFQVTNTDLAANLIYFLCTSWSLRFWSIGRYSETEVKQYIRNLILYGIARVENHSPAK